MKTVKSPKKEQRGRKWPISIDFVKTDGFVN